MVVLGADPGTSPAFGLYGGPECCPMVFAPMGVTRDAKKVVDGKSKTVQRTDPDVPGILHIIDTYRPDICAIELVGSMPGQGVSSMFRFGHASGLLEGIVQGRGIRLTKVRPQAWKKAFRMPDGKDMSRQICVRLFPFLAKDLALVKSHNQADALLLAVYAYCLETGTPFPLC